MNETEANFTIEAAEDGAPEFLSYTRFLVQRILVPIMMTIGIVGNVITIVIMTRRRMRSSTNNYLAALATFDMMYLIFLFILSLTHYPHMNETEHYVFWRMKPYFIFLTDTCSNTSVWLTVTFTVERYIAVCHPMKGKVLCTESRAKKAIVVVFLFCFTVTLPTPFEWEVGEKIDLATNQTTLMLGFSDLGKNHMYKSVYYWTTAVTFIFVPIVLLTVFNSLLIRSVHQSKSQRSAMTSGREDNSQENKITIMLIAVVILFFFCQLPTAGHLIYSTVHEAKDAKQVEFLYGLGNIFNFLMSLNAAGNFVLYCLLSQKYRKTFVQTFCPCMRDKTNRMSSMYYQSTVCTNVDDSPGSSGRRLSNTRGRLSPKGSNTDVSHSKKGSPELGPKSTFLQVPNSSTSKVTYDDDVDSMEGDSQSRSRFCGPFRRMVRSPWRRLKRSMDIGKKETTEQVIPLKGGGNKCIVITAPEGAAPGTEWNPNSAV